MLRKFWNGLTGRASGEVERAQELIREGNLKEDAGRVDEACKLYRRAVKLAPELAATHLNLGIALTAAGQQAQAAEAYEAVLKLDPTHPYGCYNYANLAYSQSDIVKAMPLVQRAVRAKPDFAEARILLANILEEAGDLAGAVVALEEAVVLQSKPTLAGAHFNLARLLYKLGRLSDADAQARRTIELDAANPNAYSLWASILSDQGLMQESLEQLRRAIHLAPQQQDLRSRDLFGCNFDDEMGAEELYRKHLDFGSSLEQAVPIRFHKHLGIPDAQRRLRIAFVSGDFYVHPVALFLIPVLERLDRGAFEIFCYSCTERRDHVTEHIRAISDEWVESATWSASQLAQTIHADAIDILVDLSGHTGASRLAVFCERPAPVQVTWLGYLNTTGLSRVDYRICDMRTDPPESSRHHSEILLHLPDSQWCYRPFLEIESASIAPWERNGYITFGSFNHASKVTPAMCGRWAQILERVPEARLLICNVSSETKKAAILESMRFSAVSADRISFEPRTDLAHYYMIYNRVDIALDTYPYGGGTTTLDALWMGVPVVTAIGPLPVSRSAASIMSALGLTPWIADSVGDYVRACVEKAADVESIAELRRSLRARLVASPLMDEPRFVLNLQAALRRIWVDYCKNHT